MRNGMLGIAATLLLASIATADEPALSSNPDDNQALRSIIERFESRIAELEAQVKQLKHVQQSTVLGGRMLESVKPQSEAAPSRGHSFDWNGFKIAVGSRWEVDRSGVIRESNGRKVGLWGVDITPDGTRW